MDPLDANDTSVLAQAAKRFGVERRYWDIWGKQHEASEEALRAILRSLGVHATSDAELQQVLTDRDAAEWIRPLPATIVVSQSNARVGLSVPERLRHSKVKFEIRFEGDGASSAEVALDDLEDSGTGDVAGQRYIRKAVPLGAGLPLGYHRLRLTLDGSDSAARLIVCPERAFQPLWLKDKKCAGLALSLYGVRSGRNWGCGDCTDLEDLMPWAFSAAGVRFIALNPVHAIPNRQPYNTSPYLPNSIFFRNHIYLDIEKIPEFAASPCAQRLAASPAVQAELAALRDSKYVEYERVSRLKLRFLKLLFRSFLRNEYGRGSTRAEEFEEYIKQQGKLLDLYATHSALDDAMHKSNREVWNWPAWPAEYQEPDSPATQEFARSHWRSVLLHKYIQWQIHTQFARAHGNARGHGLSLGLYHDLALATDRFGSDLWAHRAFYAEGCRVGSPPDSFSPKGQDWSFPPPNSERHFEDGYQLFAESIRRASAHGGALRIDHVMRLFRLYWIPDGLDATQGTYVQDRYEDLVRILALESVQRQFMVIGEDLGTVPDFIRDTLKQFGILSYRLFYFEQDQSGRFYRPDEYPAQALVSATTHDLPTLAGFWQGADIDARRAAGIIANQEDYRSAFEERAQEKRKILDLLGFAGDAREIPELTGELHNAIIGFLASTPCQLFLVNQEDLFKDTEQQNLPGTTAEHPNWRHKMKFTLEEITSGATSGYADMLRGWIEKTGRLGDSRR